MHFTAVDYLIWAITNVCNAILLWLLWKGQARSNLSFFTAYIFLKATQSVALIVVLHLVTHGLVEVLWYSGIYAALLAVEYVLQLGMLYQLYYRLLKPYKVLPARAFYIFLVGCALILLASAIIVVQQPASLSTHISSIFADFSRSISLLQCAGYFFVVAFATSLGLPYRHTIVGVALGMGIARLGELAVAALLSEWGLRLYDSIRYLPDLVYLCAVLIWIEYFRREESARIALHPAMLASLQKLQRAVDRFSWHRPNAAPMIPRETHEDPQHR